MDEELDKLRAEMLEQKNNLNEQLTVLKNQIVRTKEEKEKVGEHVRELKNEIKRTEM